MNEWMNENFIDILLFNFAVRVCKRFSFLCFFTFYIRTDIMMYYITIYIFFQKFIISISRL
jgi:hypothetical protein